MNLFLQFFAATIVKNPSDNPVLKKKNVEKIFLIDIMTLIDTGVIKIK